MAEKFSATMDEVWHELNTYIQGEESIALIKKAADFAEFRHAGQLRKSGEPYMVHLINVAYILSTLHVGPETIAAGFLHDIIEDTGITKDELAELFTPEIAELVEAVTKIGALQFKGKDDPEYQAANHRKLFIAMARDVRVILIKLSDRLHNMRTLQFQSEASQMRIAAETLDVYAPIAHRLGINGIKNELEDLCFYYLNREEYYHIAHLVESKKTERDAAVEKMISEISVLLKENGLEFRIFGRSKHLYSIYRKMVKKSKRFDEILDLLAIRIITKTKLNCYEILGYIHAKYTPIPGRLKDYIAVPKSNMYQSLHTTIISDESRIFEIQIRTEEMDDIAERGVAAHWRYKEGSKYDSHARQKEIEEKLSWFRDFASYSDEPGGTASDFMSDLKHDVFEANVYVMTPKGRIIDLPNGATPIDFAYRVHTDVGHTTVGAIVNNAMVPLNTELHTGDVVQIKTMKGTGPSEDWLKFAKTNQARNKIRAFLTKKENERRAEEIKAGEKILTDELTRRGFNASEYMEKKKVESVLKEFGVPSYAGLMYGLAVKSINATMVCEKLTNQKRSISEIELSRLMKRNEQPKKRVASKTGVVIPGIESMKMSLAQCCLPVYGDPIVGFITKGEGVKIHRADCNNVRRLGSRLIDVRWEEEDRERLYDTNLIIEAHDRSFIFTDIVTIASQNKTPIVKITADRNSETLMCTVKMRIQVRNLNQLNQLLANLKKVESVISVERNNK